MTDEQKQKYKNSQKQYKENMTVKKNKNIKKLKINAIEIDIIKRQMKKNKNIKKIIKPYQRSKNKKEEIIKNNIQKI